MAIKKVILTQDGYDKLVEKLEYLKSVKRMEVADRLKAAIALGDLSENSEYDDAKNEQAFIEGEIIDLENKISNSEIIQVELTGDVVDIGSTVTIREVEELKKLYAKIKKLYRKEGEEAVEVADDAGSLDLLYRLSDSDFIELDSVKGERERLHRLITVTFEEVDSSDGSELYRVVDGGFVLADSDEAHSDKLYRIIEGQPLDLYGRVETLYRAYQYIDDAETYTIVGSTETNPDESRISNESPVGAALRGKKPGAIAEVHAPVGILLYEILEVK